MSELPEPTHTLAHLRDWSFAGTALAVVGQPVGHSLSPPMHNAALAVLARTHAQLAGWHYFKFDLAPGELAGALELFHARGFHGLNLTVPHKALVVPHLESRQDFVREAGAANTLSRGATGWHGANTDGYGLSTALRADLAVELAGASVILLGAGGAARAAAVECLQAGCAALWIGNRTPSHLQGLLADLRRTTAFAGARSARPGLRLEGFDPKGPLKDLPVGSVLINATSLGLKSADPAPIDLASLARPAHIFDMIYRPAQTALLRQAAALGLPHANGLSMLLHQGARSLELWTGLPAPVAVMQQAARAALAAQ